MAMSNGLGLGLPYRAFNGGGAFSPSALFAGGEQGAWYDPSDLSTMYQNSNGTGAVAVGDPVGLILDKRLGATPGAEAVTNGDLTSDTAWSKSNSVVWAAGQYTISDVGGTDSYIAQQLTGIAAGTTFRVTVKIAANNSGGSGFRCRQGNGAGSSAYGDTPLAPNFVGEWVFHLVAGQNNPWLTFLTSNTDTSVAVTSVSAKHIPGNHAIQATSTARPILRQDGGGKYYLEFDGVDDSLSTGSIDFTATDAMTLMFGANALSANTGIFLELSPIANNNTGSFYLTDREVGPAIGVFLVGGTLSTRLNTSASPPALTVSTFSADISDSVATARVNGVSAPFAQTPTLGVGNFGNYPLYIGARAGTSLFFTGSIFGLIIRGAASSAGEITSTEAYLATKTGVVL